MNGWVFLILLIAMLSAIARALGWMSIELQPGTDIIKINGQDWWNLLALQGLHHGAGKSWIRA